MSTGRTSPNGNRVMTWGVALSDPCPLAQAAAASPLAEVLTDYPLATICRKAKRPYVPLETSQQSLTHFRLTVVVSNDPQCGRSLRWVSERSTVNITTTAHNSIVS
jgi:hypothetical protein